MTEQINNKKIFQMIRSAQRILLLTDERIDGDTVGSALSFYHWLRELKKSVTVFAWRQVPSEFSYMPGIKVVETDEAVLASDYDLVIVFDCSREQYANDYLEKISNDPNIIVIDHHTSNPRFGDLNLVDDGASSTAEISWKFFKQHRISISKDMATCLLTGICTDTSLFTNDATTEASVQAVAELGLVGAKVQQVVRAFWMNNSIPALKLWGLALERLTEVKNGEVVVTYVKEQDFADTGAREEDTRSIANVLIAMVHGPSVVCVLKERADGVKVSLRSLNKDVAAFSSRWPGGGGHKKAAGFEIQGATIDDIDLEKLFLNI